MPALRALRSLFANGACNADRTCVACGAGKAGFARHAVLPVESRRTYGTFGSFSCLEFLYELVVPESRQMRQVRVRV